MRQTYLLLVIALMIVLTTTIATAAPTVYPVSPPAWYNDSIPPGTVIIIKNATLPELVNITGTYFTSGEIGARKISVYLNPSGNTLYYINFTFQWMYPANITAAADYDGLVEHWYVYVNGSLVYDTSDSNMTTPVNIGRNSNVSLVMETIDFSYDHYVYIYFHTRWIFIKNTTSIAEFISVNDSTTNAYVRAPSGQAFVITNATAWLDEAYISAPGTYSFEWAPYLKIESNVTATYSDGTFNLTAPAYVTPLPSSLTCGTAYVAPLFPGDVIACWEGTPDANITFTVRQYGTNYTAIELRTPDGKIIGRKPLDPLGQAVIPARLGDAVLVYFLAPGKTRAWGTLVLAYTSYTLTLLPTSSGAPPLGSLRAYYNRTAKALIIDVGCAAPPCNVNITKTLANGTVITAATYVCNTPTCHLVFTTDDPLFTVTCIDAEGTNYKAWAGTSLPGSEWAANITDAFGRLLDAPGLGLQPVDYVALIASLTVFFAFTTAKKWEWGLLALGFLLSLFGLWAGSTVAAPGLAITFGAIASMVAKRLRQE